MGRALRCDRCGKYYDFYYKNIMNDGNCVTGMKFIGSRDYNDLFLIRRVDLCRECSESLEKWFTERSNDKK